MQSSLLQNSLLVVDHDAMVRSAISAIFSMEGFSVYSFECGEELLEAAQTLKPACIFISTDMPDGCGYDILRKLKQHEKTAPVFMLSERRDTPSAVRAIKNGAHDFVEKPFDADAIILKVREAMEARHARLGAKPSCLDRLTPRERDVLHKIAAGLSNKEAGRELKISPRTIEVHRARIMEKLGAKNAADMVRIVMSQQQQH